MKIIIMAGGKGTRFWPQSTEAVPKQFLRLTSDETMLQSTYRRFAQWLPAESLYVVTTLPYADLIRKQLPGLTDDRLIIEPEQRDTGPCTALTALHFLHRDDDEVMVFTPSDHYIPDSQELRNVLLTAEDSASIDRTIVTLGIVPTRPETGFGYIETTGSITEGSFEVLRFIEKPNEEKAQFLLTQANVYWNSGIFVWKPSTIEYYMKLHQQQIWEPLAQARHAEALHAIYPVLPKISVDYAILEKADVIRMVPASFEWDDVGTWTALERIRIVDENGNMLQGNIHAYRTNNSIVYTENHKTIVIGVQDLIIVSTAEGLLICHKTKEQEIKKALQEMQDSEKEPEGEN